jgi:hypothetical protein
LLELLLHEDQVPELLALNAQLQDELLIRMLRPTVIGANLLFLAYFADVLLREAHELLDELALEEAVLDDLVNQVADELLTVVLVLVGFDYLGDE